MYTFCGRMLPLMKLKWLNASHLESDLHQKLSVFRVVRKEYLL